MSTSAFLNGTSSVANLIQVAFGLDTRRAKLHAETIINFIVLCEKNEEPSRGIRERSEKKKKKGEGKAVHIVIVNGMHETRFITKINKKSEEGGWIIRSDFLDFFPRKMEIYRATEQKK